MNGYTNFKFHKNVKSQLQSREVALMEGKKFTYYIIYISSYRLSSRTSLLDRVRFDFVRNRSFKLLFLLADRRMELKWGFSNSFV